MVSIFSHPSGTMRSLTPVTNRLTLYCTGQSIIASHFSSLRSPHFGMPVKESSITLASNPRCPRNGAHSSERDHPITPVFFHLPLPPMDVLMLHRSYLVDVASSASTWGEGFTRGRHSVPPPPSLSTHTADCLLAHGSYDVRAMYMSTVSRSSCSGSALFRHSC